MLRRRDTASSVQKRVTAAGELAGCGICSVTDGRSPGRKRVSWGCMKHYCPCQCCYTALLNLSTVVHESAVCRQHAGRRRARRVQHSLPRDIRRQRRRQCTASCWPQQSDEHCGESDVENLHIHPVFPDLRCAFWNRPSDRIDSQTCGADHPSCTRTAGSARQGPMR